MRKLLILPMLILASFPPLMGATLSGRGETLSAEAKSPPSKEHRILEADRHRERARARATTTTTTIASEVVCDPQCVAYVNAVLFDQWITYHVHRHPFLVCTRSHESSHTPPLYDNGYGAVSGSGTYRGAYQFSQQTWDSTARHAGWHHLVGVDPARATVRQQDFMALHLYEWQGKSPWGGRC